MQSAFNGGEVSPDVWARTSYDKYDSSLKTMLNFYPRFCGGATNRAGTEFIAEVKDSDTSTRLIPFQFSAEQAYIIEAGDKYFRYYKDGGQIINTSANASDWVTATSYTADTPIVSSSVVYRCILAHTSDDTNKPATGASWETYWVQSDVVETTNTYSEDDLSTVKTAQSADTLFLCHSSYKPKALTRSSHYNWSFSDYNFENGPFRTTNITDTTITPSATTGDITLTASSSIFTANHVGSLFQISHDVTGQVLNLEYKATTTSSSIKCKGTWSIVTHGTWHGIVKIERSIDDGVTFETLRSYSGDEDINVSESGTTDVLTYLRITYTHTSGTCYIDLNAYSYQSNGVVKITGVTTGTSATATVQTDLAFTTATTDWAMGAWNEEYGYPSCCQFFQNRLAFAGSTKDPLTIWFSQIGDYPNFLVNYPIEDDDAITAPLVSSGVNLIRSMLSLGYMICFTGGGLWKVGTGSESTALTPSTVRATQQDYIGASTLSPLAVNTQILCCNEMGTTVNGFGYNAVSDAYQGTDLGVLVGHLFRHHEIVDWAYAQAPDSVIWAVRDDGVLLSFSYLPEQKVWAWARHTTDGYFESVASIPGDKYTEVWFIVKRKVNGVYKRYVERLADRNVSTEPEDQHFVDSGLTYNNPKEIIGATQASPVVLTVVGHGYSAGDYIDISDMTGMTELNGYRYKVGTVTDDTIELLDMDEDTNIDGTEYSEYEDSGYTRKCVQTVSGLDHLEGKTVSILADGSVDTPQEVVDGSITLTDLASRIHIGLGYTCEMETLNIDYPLTDGTAQGRIKRIANVTVRLEDTAGGSIGINGSDNLQTIKFALGDVWSKAPDLYTGDKSLNPISSWSADARITIQQTDPLPITVLAIMAEVQIGA